MTDKGTSRFKPRGEHRITGQNGEGGRAWVNTAVSVPEAAGDIVPHTGLTAKRRVMLVLGARRSATSPSGASTSPSSLSHGAPPSLAQRKAAMTSSGRSAGPHLTIQRRRDLAHPQTSQPARHGPEPGMVTSRRGVISGVHGCEYLGSFTPAANAAAADGELEMRQSLSLEASNQTKPMMSS